MGGGRSPSTRHEKSMVVSTWVPNRSLIAVRVAVVACGDCSLATRRKTTKNDGVQPSFFVVCWDKPSVADPFY